MQKIKVLVVDDHTIVRDGICALLALVGDIEVVGEAANGSEALKMVKELEPDVVLMDITMPVMDGLEATRRIRRKFPRIRVLALTQYDDKEYVFPVIAAGDSGFISKVAASSELTSGIRSIYQGDSYLSPSVARLLIEDYQRGGGQAIHEPYERLTNREREVLKLAALGHSNKDIARELNITQDTVKKHMQSILGKLHASSRIHAVIQATRAGIIKY